MNIKNAITVLLLALVSTSLFGQNKYVSCHHTKKKIKVEPMTKKQKDDMLKNIARSDTFDILHYDLHLDVRDYTGDYLIGNTIITYAPKMDGVTSITLDLRQLTVDSITANGVPLTYSHIDSDLVIDLPTETITGEEGEISIWYQGTPYLDPQWGGFYFQNNYIYNLGIGISTIPPNFGKVWYPCFDTYVERALYDFYVTSDDGWKAYCQGDLIEEVVIDEETVMRHYSLDKPIPTYLSAIAVADYESYEYVHTGVNGDIPVRLTSKPNNQADMQSRFAGLGNSIDALEYWFGPEYWGQIGYVLTVDGAMEHPTNIAYPQSMMGASVFLNEDLFTHELGHHWWGDMVSQSTYNHMWLKEGPAEYSQHLMREFVGGTDAYLDAVKLNHETVMESAHIDDEGYQVLSPIPDAHIYGTHSYNKGASIMHSMRGYMGDEMFRQGLQFVLDSTLNGVLDPELFSTLLTLNTGVEMADFFNDWVYKPGFASFELNAINTTEDGGVYTHDIEVEQKLRECPELYSNVPIEITAFAADMSRFTSSFVADGELTNVEMTTDFEPLFFAINTNNQLNLAKLDNEYEIVEETNTVTIPYTEFKVKVNTVGEPSKIFVEHQWVSPDQGNLAANIDEISDSQYWTINGNWDELTFVEGRLSYWGSNENAMDWDLFGDTEEGALLVYREGPEMPWQEYPYYTPFIGSLTNGNGSFRIDSLLTGEYTFGKGETLVGLEEFNSENVQISVYPNPVYENFKLDYNVTTNVNVELVDGAGRMVKSWHGVRNDNRNFDVSNLSTGQYILRIYTEKGPLIGKKKIVIE